MKGQKEGDVPRKTERMRKRVTFVSAGIPVIPAQLSFPPCVLKDSPCFCPPPPNKSLLSLDLAWVGLCSFPPKDHWLSKQCQYFLQSESIRTGKGHCTMNKALLWSAVVMRTVELTQSPAPRAVRKPVRRIPLTFPQCRFSCLLTVIGSEMGIWLWVVQSEPTVLIYVLGPALTTTRRRRKSKRRRELLSILRK